MATNNSYFDSITPATPTASIKLFVKLVTKKCPVTSVGKKSVQSYSFIDEKGTRRRGVAFGTDVDYFNRRLTPGCAYEIVNVLIKNVNSTFELYPGEVQLNLTRHTKLRLLDSNQEKLTFTITHIPLSQITTRINAAAFDIIVIVLRADPPHRVSLRGTEASTQVADLYVADDSSETIVQLSAWRTLGTECQQITKSNTQFCVAQFTCMKATQFLGQISLSTTSETEISVNPTESRAASLEKWSISNIAHLKERLAAAVAERSPRLNISPSTLADALAKKPADVEEDSLLRIDACIKSFNGNSPRSIYSCPQCSKPATGIPTAAQKCDACSDAPHCIARLFLDFTITDNGTEYSFEAYPRTAEKILNIKPITFHLMSAEERANFINDAMQSLQHKKISFVIGPNRARLVDFAEVQWELRYISGQQAATP